MSADLARAKILIVDDVPANIRLLANILKDAGEILAASNGHKALKIAASHHPDLILLDIMMSKMDGFEVCEKLKANPETKESAVIFVTAKSDSGDETRGLALGAVDFLSKPVNPAVVRMRVETHLTLKRQRDNLESLVERRTAKLLQANIQIKEREAYLNAILDNALDAIITIDLHGRVVDFNAAAEELFGFSKKDIMGKDIVEWIVPLEFRLRYQQAIKRYNKNRDTKNPPKLKRRVEMAGLRSDGKIVDLSIALMTISRQGEHFFTAFLHDITDRKQLLKSLKETLDVAEESNRTKSEFIANMSHEIRTPMNAVMGFTELMLRDDLPEKAHNSLIKIKNASHSLMSIINDILDFSKIEAGKMVMDPEVFYVQDLFDRLSNLFSQQVLDKGIKLNFSTPPLSETPLFGDVRRLEQVLINLIGNAIKFTKKGFILVSLDLTDKDFNQVLAIFKVQDSGIGVEKQKLKQLFEPFLQADGSTTRNYGGTGLGLTISRSLVIMMGGKIWAESVLGEGSLFSFQVPLELREAVLGASEKPSTNLQTMEQCEGGRILVVDDNVINQEITKEILERVCMDVVVACDGREAVDKINQSSFHMVLMDIHMPHMDGYEATQRIRSDQKFKDLPIVAMTASALPEDRKKCIESGMNDHLSKPLNVEKMYALLTRWVVPTLKPSTISENVDTLIFPEISGIDQVDGLQRVAGNKKLYHRLLLSFLEGHTHSAQAVVDALKKGDVESAARLIHAIKGVAGNIGAKYLHKVALDLEKSVKSGDSRQWDRLTDMFVFQFTNIIKSLETFRNTNINTDAVVDLDVKIDHTPIDTDIIIPLFTELAQHLDEYSLETGSLMLDIKSQLNNSHAVQDFKKMERCMSQYDFSSAREALDKLIHTLGISLTE